MTNEETLEIAKGRLGYATAQSLCDTIGYWKAEKELFKGIVDALEKQMPKKPIQESMNCVVIQCCPTCRHMFFDASRYTSSDRYYCSNCGQKLDWGITEYNPTQTIPSRTTDDSIRPYYLKGE